MIRETGATLFLEKQNIPFSLHHYEYNPNGGLIGMQAADAIGADPASVLKTLVVEIDKKQPACVVAPSHQKLNLKKVAALFGGRNARMMPPEKAHELTGYQSGGTSPFGQLTPIPVVLSQDAMNQAYVYINAGHQGFVVRISPQDAQRITDARVADVAAD
ncbi:Cys-tRNA(Pro) deacylase [Gluconobacter japonicus]|uniref:Cys-tRNA(Pro)/Cys-tRNA(Cys) deacylase n=1 Tax=Gluconobacter japonicus TaxID=376620 RepID=A0A9Q2FPS9_GLUJA|nr:Cys-tRNA(Pro) deacylase [Gluconobacter japonicus]KXV25119.1 ATP-binding protein [Gluconobacter japonicus]KXV29554.1 ATP-binding protein [Gluconobacter japonicus]MBF0871018.1 Cys-tRNA(Pro) deacylase [Gluconobacter japonicus]GBR26702.1 regulatory protein [Gluconobacter japonicus NBRC 3271]GLQ59673.1 Cys-tRNA(Pro)/Cys-tRNA(Cys) deacylase [Gluconobacter japonicus]